MSKLSIIIPAYNEGITIAVVLKKIDQLELPLFSEKEIIVVDDCSYDDTAEAVANYKRKFSSSVIKYLRHSTNRGKGASLRTGFKEITGDFVIIQDADLEYDPKDYMAILEPLCDGFADVVYGSRFVGGKPHRILFFWHTIGNRFLTFLSNMLTNLNLTDMESGYKAFRSNVIKNIVLKENRFGFEPEITAKIARIPNIRIYEVGISYHGRTYEEGKKINWKDGFRAIFCILKYNMLRDNSISEKSQLIVPLASTKPVKENAVMINHSLNVEEHN